MATKDYSIYTTDKRGIVWHSNKKSVMVYKDFVDVSNNWIFRVTSHTNLTRNLVKKDFLTKTKALAYAKSYMRKH